MTKREPSGGMEITSTVLLTKLTQECRKFIDASGLEGGTGGGWAEHNKAGYDPLLTDIRCLTAEAEALLANAANESRSDSK